MEPTAQSADNLKPAGKKSRKLADVEGHLRSAIISGRYPVGSRIPTETELTLKLGVSRSVLREAVAALRNEGLLRSRQGAGVYVVRREAEQSALSLLTEASATISDVIEELELRLSVEVEAAGLASERASPAQLAEIQTSHAQFGRDLAGGKSTVDADYALHLAIARATNNRRFETFLAHLGARTIPRGSLHETFGYQSVDLAESRLHSEHDEIVTTILSGDAVAARAAMRAHLGSSILRYRELISTAIRT